MTDDLRRHAASRILVLDGAMGTMIQAEKPDEATYRGARFAAHPQDLGGNNELLSLTAPEMIRGIHEAFLDAGADILCTNTFSATAISQADYGLEGLVTELNAESARLAREAAASRTTPERPRWVAGAIGPTNQTASISPDVNDPGLRKVTFDGLAAAYGEAARALVLGGVDLLLTPSTPSAAFGLGEKTSDPLSMYLNDIFTVTANLAGLPGISVPAGLDANRLPLGLQLIGKPFDEETVFRGAKALEDAAGFTARPDEWWT